MVSKKIVIAVALITAITGSLYWITVFSGLFPVDELVPGYKSGFMAFPVADGWMFACALLAAVFAWKDHSLAALFAPLAGASMIFLGLYAFAYGANTGLLFNLTLDELVEIAIKPPYRPMSGANRFYVIGPYFFPALFYLISRIFSHLRWAK